MHLRRCSHVSELDRRIAHSLMHTICLYVRILWPIDADQPPNAIHLTEDLGVAYELLEVRNGTGLGTIYRTRKTPNGTIAAVKSEVLDVLARAFGPDGDKKRVRLSELKSKLQRAWEQDGEAWQDLVGFLANV